MPNLPVGTIVMYDRAHVLIAKAISGPDAGLWTIPNGVIGDGETVRNASVRSIKEDAGVDVEPKMTLFICERVVSDDHRVAVFVLAEPVLAPASVASSVLPSEPVLIPGAGYSDVRWVDVRNLGDVQKNEGMSDFTADAFVKFSGFLKTQASATSGRVN